MLPQCRKWAAKAVARRGPLGSIHTKSTRKFTVTAMQAGKEDIKIQKLSVKCVPANPVIHG
jgi:hypothetical protein